MKIIVYLISSMVLAFLATACVAIKPDESAGIITSRYSAMSIRDLMENRHELDGRVVKVFGFYYEKPPIAALYPDKDSFEKGNASLILWIGSDRPNSKAESIARRSHAWAVIEGTLKNQSVGVFDQFSAQLVDVTDFQVLSEKPEKVGK